MDGWTTVGMVSYNHFPILVNSTIYLTESKNASVVFIRLS